MVAVNFESVAPPGDMTDVTTVPCEVCGAPVPYSGRGPKPKFCSDHKSPSSRNQQGATTKAKGSTKKTNKTEASESQWNDFLAMALVAGTYVVARYAVGGNGLLLDPPAGMSAQQLDAHAQDYSMNGAEAAPIAKFMAGRASSSVVNKKVGFIVVHALELEDIGGALWDYGKRIGPVLGSRIRGNTSPLASMAQNVHPIRPTAPVNSTPQPAAQPVQESPARERVVVNESPTGPSNASIVADAIAKQRRLAPPDIGDD